MIDIATVIEIFPNTFEEYKNIIFTFKELISNSNLKEDSIVLAVSPQPYDYEEFEELLETDKSELDEIDIGKFASDWFARLFSFVSFFFSFVS